MRFMILFTFIVLTTILAGCSGNVEENITGKAVDTSTENPSICMIDAECDDEGLIESEITQEPNSNNTVIVYFFWGDGCPHCSEEKPFLDTLKQKYSSLDIKMFETWYNRENAELFQKTAELFDTSAQGVPTTFIGDKYWIGFAEYMKPEIENYVKYCLENECQNVLDK